MRLTRPTQVGAVLLAVMLSSVTYNAAPVVRAATNAAIEVCSPLGVARDDLHIQTKSTLPGYAGRPSRLDVHSVRPVYSEDEDEKCGNPPRAVVLVHGASTEGTTTFDLRFKDYSLMEGLAWAGIDSFAVNLLGYGFSTRFGLDNPCNASADQQKTFLIPNPLSAPCVSPDPFKFTNTSAAVDQLDAVVDRVRSRAKVDAVSLFGWSRGGVVIGAYALLHPEKVQSLAFLASGYDFGNPDPKPGSLLIVRDRAAMFAEWAKQLDATCPGQQDTGILGPIWDSSRARDSLGSSWGSDDPRTGGIQRAPSWDVWGWDRERAATVTLPALVITGLLDLQNPYAREVRLFNDLGSGNKVLIKIACASHQALWEGTTTATWEGGPHRSIKEALVEWITSNTFRGVHRGSFQISATGSITAD
jgi:pimeloyl-ACP methyl ester carboxylesterase